MCLVFPYSYLETIMAIVRSTPLSTIPSTTLNILSLLLLLVSMRASAVGVLKFKLIDFETDGTLNDGTCCDRGHNGSQCVCQAYVHVCIGVGSEHRKYHRDCALIHHNSAVIARNKMTGIYAVNIPFDVRWPLKNVSLTVEMRHWNDKSTIIRSERFVQLSPLSNEAIRIEEKGIARRVAYKAQIECAQFYYGPECAIFCQPNIANFHFYCSSNGERLCKEGWSGQNCDDPICPKGCGNGICIAPNICRCRSGWQGEMCDRCRVLEGCKHGYCIKADECICEKNWGGTFCDRDLDYCYHNSPCQNGGKCSSGGLQNYYYCNCTSGYTGQNCELKVDPCRGVDCGYFGKCIAKGENIECVCDADHFGIRCQHKLRGVDVDVKKKMHGRISNSCKLSENDYIPNGFSWTTIDCRQCVCSKSLISCTEVKCEPRDCLRSDPTTGQPVNCPKQQQCTLVRKGDCLKGPCIFPRGECLSWAQVNKQPSKVVCRQRVLDGRRNTFGCASMLAEFDLEILPKGTAVEDICHHLLLDVTAANMYDVGFDCSRRHGNLIEIEIISLKFTSDVTVVKEFLKSRLRDRLTASAVLNAAIRVGDYNENEQIVWERGALRGANSAEKEKVDWLSTNHMLTVIVCLMMLIVIILLNICILKYPGSCFRKNRDASQFEMSDSAPRVYCTQPIIIRNNKLKRHSGDRTSHGHEYCTTDMPFLQHNFTQKYSTGSTDSGIADKEQEDNERNARLLDARLEDNTYGSTDFPSCFESRAQSSVFRTPTISSRTASNCFATNIPLKYVSSGLDE